MDEKKSPKKKSKKRMGCFPILLLIVFILSLSACGYLLYGEVAKEMSIKDMENDIHAFMRPMAVQTPADNGADVSDQNETEAEISYTFDWDGMLVESENVVGWIQVAGIERINYPIVQHSEDNQFYLTHDWKGTYQVAGSIFLNKLNTNDFSDMNSIVYGHFMNGGSMFGELKKFENQAFLDENHYFYIYTPDGRKLTYEIICCSQVKDGSDAYMMRFDSPDERMAYYAMMLNNAIAKRDVSLDRLDTTVMLSTCSNMSGYYDRRVILGKLVEIDLKGNETATEIS